MRKHRPAGSRPASRDSSPGCGTPSTGADRPRGAPSRIPPVFVADRADLERDSIVLAGAEGRHAATVLRLAPGERADLTDGAGALAQCVVTRAGPGELELAVLARRCEPPPDARAVVVQAIPKGDRGELAVGTMTEVGVDVIVPWPAERCVARWQAERGERALARWRSAAVEAAKQARRPRFPEVTVPAATRQVAERVSTAGLALLLDPAAPVPLAGLEFPRSGDIVLIVGPEGGISPAETAAFSAAGAVSARLGPSVLRTSTAGAVAAALVLSRCGRWR